MAALLARVARGIRALGGKRDVGVFRRGDIVWELDLKEGIDFAIYLQGVRARDLAGYRRSCSRSLSVLNIGADIGSHTLPLARMEGPSGRVYSFEPTDCAFGKQGAIFLSTPSFPGGSTRSKLCLWAAQPKKGPRPSHPVGLLITKVEPSSIRSTWADSTRSKGRSARLPSAQLELLELKSGISSAEVEC
jgi:hypothetical protein